MERRGLLAAVATFLGVFATLFSVERLTNTYFLTDNPLYGVWSGLRIELFIAAVVVGSLLSGAALRRTLPAASAATAAVIAFLLVVYAWCVPKVCYSAGLDGLEPARLAFDLGMMSVAASGSGAYMATRTAPKGRAYLAVGFATFISIGYYPVIFTFAGARILHPFDPWAAGALLFALSATVSLSAYSRAGPGWGLALPLAAGGSLFLVCGPIAAAYISTVALPAAVMGVAVFAGALAGSGAGRARWTWAKALVGDYAAPLWAMLVAVLLMLVVVVPDASVGWVPRSGAQNYVMGVPSYAGAYMDTALGDTRGVALSLSFQGTNASVIQPDNFLGAGIGAHSPGCCVDGIDYGYGFYIYAFRSGNATLVATAWKVCDDNAACGGHSWKVLMFQRVSPAPSSALRRPVRIAIEWKGRTALWEYAVDGGPEVNFTSFAPESAEKAYFNTGWIGTISHGALGNTEAATFFYQFGVMSAYPLGHGGWSVSFSCPATLQAGRWWCVTHARTLQGGESFWKVIWRWGEDYPNVSAARSPAAPDGVVFSYSANSTMASFVRLW
jgi:hypothetical protein